MTNPPIDSIRESLVMSLVSLVGPRPNLLGLETGGKHIRLELHQPILTNVDLEKIRRIEDSSRRRVPHLYPVDLLSGRGRARRVWRMRSTASAAMPRRRCAPATTSSCCRTARSMPTMSRCRRCSRVAAVHHHLIRGGLRTEVGLVVETGEARQLHDFCLLAGYGAEAINPYLAFDTLASLQRELEGKLSPGEAEERYIKAVAKGILKVMSKMGICTFQSYCGAQIFDAVGLNSAVARPLLHRHGVAGRRHRARRGRRGNGAPPPARLRRCAQLSRGARRRRRARLPRQRRDAMSGPSDTVALLQHAVRGNNYRKFKEYHPPRRRCRRTGSSRCAGSWTSSSPTSPVPLDEVEPAAEIVKRFATGAMSFGSISWEAHTTLAIAMNRMGGKSNTGEGGEDPQRYKRLPNGDSMRSAIKQVASGRFGVTAEYLVNADVMQIKMAQGAKPGEGGQLPGHKVDDWIARTRHAIPGVGLISPPPHHDIYSIEDLAQLIHDLKNVNPRGRGQRQARRRDRRRHHRRGRRQGLCRPRHHLRSRGRHRRLAA